MHRSAAIEAGEDSSDAEEVSCASTAPNAADSTSAHPRNASSLGEPEQHTEVVEPSAVDSCDGDASAGISSMTCASNQAKLKHKRKQQKDALHQSQQLVEQAAQLQLQVAQLEMRVEELQSQLATSQDLQAVQVKECEVLRTELAAATDRSVGP